MKKKAFTLVEIMAVVALIAILFVIFIPRIGFAANKTKVVGVQTDFRSYETAMQSTVVENITLSSITKEQPTTPEKSTILATKLNEYLDPALQIKADEFGVLSTEKKDPWGTPYTVGYSEPDDAFYLYSFGADKVPGREYKHVPTEAVGDDLIMVQKCNIIYTYGFPVNSKNDNKPNSPVLMTGLTITKAPTKLVYQIGENFDPTGMEVKASYSNGTEGVITDYIVTDGTKMAAGKSVVTISYTEETVTKTALQSIEVKNPLISIKIGTEPTKKNYTVGENFDSAGMVVVATYTDGNSVPISGYTVTCGKPLTDKDVSVIISYTEDGITKTVSQVITVTNPLISIAITKAPTKTEYIAGTNFDVTGMVVTATYTNKSTKVIPVSEYRVTDGTNLTVNRTNVTVSYMENGITKTALQSITVTNPLVSIAITKAPTKTAYIPGENFDPTGMVVTATYTNKETKVVSGIVIDGTALVIGKSNVTISYTENGVTKSVSQAIVVKNSLSSIIVTKAPTKMVYVSGERFDPTGMEITATYANGTKKIATGWTVIGNTEIRPENKSVTISYTDDNVTKETTQTVMVEINETVFTYSDGKTEKIDITGALSKSHYSESSGVKLTGVVIGRHVTSIGNSAFWECTSLTSVIIPNSVKSIGNFSFISCEALTSINIPNSVTTMGGYAFCGCIALTSVIIPNNLAIVEGFIFKGCDALASVSIPGSVTTIKRQAFMDCIALARIDIPSSVSTIESEAFQNVPHIYYSGSASGRPWGAKAIN